MRSGEPYRETAKHGGLHVYRGSRKGQWWACCDNCQEHHGPFPDEWAAVGFAQGHVRQPSHAKGLDHA